MTEHNVASSASLAQREPLNALGVGIHDVDPAWYYADPCPEPSLTSSGIKRLLSGSPAEFRAHHPRMTEWPELLERETDAQRLGQIVHSMVLGKGASFVAGNLDNFTTKKGTPAKTWNAGEARAWKEEQEAAGNLVLKIADYSRVRAAADSMIEMLREEFGEWPIGGSEQTVIWQRETEYGKIWCRGLLDHFSLRHVIILDPKSTDLPIDDRSIERTVANQKWHIQAAWYREGIAANYPALLGRVTFRFPVVEISPPFQSRFIDLPNVYQCIAEREIDRAANRFAKSLRSGNWPPLSRVCNPEPPPWMLAEYESIEVSS